MSTIFYSFFTNFFGVEPIFNYTDTGLLSFQFPLTKIPIFNIIIPSRYSKEENIHIVIKSKLAQ